MFFNSRTEAGAPREGRFGKLRRKLSFSRTKKGVSRTATAPPAVEADGKAVAVPPVPALPAIVEPTTTEPIVHFLSTPLIYILGPPGSGKGTQCERLLASHPELRHVSVGDLLRNAGDKYQAIMKEGKLVGVNDIIEILREWLVSNVVGKEGVKGVLLDGFPRDVEQCKAFENEFGATSTCLYFNAPTPVLLERLKLRGETSGRDDDNEETIQKRLDTFEEKTVAVKEVLGDRCVEIDATGDVDSIAEKAKEALDGVLERAKKGLEGVEVCFVLGGPGSGKGTQCSRLAKTYDLEHISTGDLLRAEVQRKSWIGRQCSAIMAGGKMVPLGVILHLVQLSLTNPSNSRTRYLLDGFPRKLDQAEAFDSQLVPVKFVIYFECKAETMKERLLKRGESSGRSDDNEETIKTRISIFEEESLPVISRYAEMDKLIQVSSEDSPDSVYEKVSEGVSKYWELPSEEEAVKEEEHKENVEEANE